MNIKERRILIESMRIMVGASGKATGDGLLRLFNAYNHLHRQLDGETVACPPPPRPMFVYDTRAQMMRTL